MKPTARLVAAITLAGLWTSGAAAQDWPNRPVTVVLPIAAGGGIDAMARAIAEEFLGNAKQAMVIENRPGGGGIVAAEVVAKGNADGYTLLYGNTNISGILPNILKQLPFDPINDFTPIAAAIEQDVSFVVHKDVPVSNAKELAAYAKAHPGMSFGHPGQGSVHHIAGEYFSTIAGVNLTFVPYRGAAPALTDMLAGQIPLMAASLTTVLPHVASGQVKILGMIGPNRMRADGHEFPSMSESLPGFSVPVGWQGFLGPKNMPPALVNRIQDELIKAVKGPRVQTAADKTGSVVKPSTAAELDTRIRKELDIFKDVVAKAKIQPQ